MSLPELSLLRICHWIDSVNREDLGYYPPSPKNEMEVIADKHIRARFALCTKAIMRVSHQKLMSSKNFAPVLARLADLPPELMEVYSIYIRTAYFENGSRIAAPWMKLLVNMEKPERGWARLLWQAGLINPLNGARPHPESVLGLYFKVLLENQREYRNYRDGQASLLEAGKSVRVLGPVDYFRNKGWTEDGGGLGFTIFRDFAGAVEKPVAATGFTPDR